MLSVKKIEALQPDLTKSKTKHLDANGLYLYVTKNSNKSFYFVYKFGGKKCELCLGRFEDIGLKEARIKRDEYQALLRRGIDPKSENQKKKAKHEVTFPPLKDLITEFCQSKLKNNVWTEKTYDKNLLRFQNHIIPALGNICINELSKTKVIDVFSNMSRGGVTDTAHRLRQMLKKILRKAATEDLIEINLVRDIEDALYEGNILEARPQARSFPALTKKEDVCEFFKSCLHYTGDILTIKLLELSANLFLRPSEIRTLKWSQVDFNHSQIVIDIKKGRFQRQHLVPMSKQSKKIFLELSKLTGTTEFVFYSSVSKYMTISENTVNQAIRRMGYAGKMTAHGFRAMVTTSIREQLKTYRNDVIEVQLSHLLPNQTRRAYDRAEYIDERKQMMQDWSNYLYSLIS